MHLTKYDTNIWNGNRVGHQYALINTNDINLIWTPYNANESKNVSNFIFKQKSKYEAKDLGTSNLTKWYKGQINITLSDELSINNSIFGEYVDSI
jgi:hypothetical protein